jgi:hypothetical protein
VRRDFAAEGVELAAAPGVRAEMRVVDGDLRSHFHLVR